jgi:REP element-mobilizing transposase RayT
MGVRDSRSDATPSPRTLIIAHHLIWTAYGWWLPNDPRGSMSTNIASAAIAELGELHYGRKKLQPAGWVLRDFYGKAEEAVQHPLLTSGRAEIPAVAESFAQCVRRSRYTCYACAILCDHVHMLLRKHRDDAATMIQEMQEASRLDLQRSGLRAGHPVWGGSGWKVFLHTPDDIRRTIRYIEGNPPKMHLPAQRWSFVKEYDGWPLRGRE